MTSAQRAFWPGYDSFWEYLTMARIFSVFSKVMFFSILGLFFLQGNSLGHFDCFSLQLHISNSSLFHCKVFSMPWLYPSTTPEVSGYPAAHRRGCLRQLPGESPDPSAALAIPTRIKNASTTVIWISSGSTHPSKAHAIDCFAHTPNGFFTFCL